MKALIEAVKSEHKPAIVYCATRSETELITEQLGKEGQHALAYHAELSKHERDAWTEGFHG